MADDSVEAPVFQAPQPRIIRNYLLAAAAVCLLSLFPYTGIILMIFMGPLWASLLINAMMIHLTLRTVLSNHPKIWLAIPICFYAVWATYYATRSYSDKNALRSFESLNRIDEKIPQAVDLIFDKDDPLAPAVKKVVIGGRVFAGNFEIQVIQSKGANTDGCFSQKSYGYFRATPDYDQPSTCAIGRAGAAPQAGVHFRPLPDADGLRMSWRQAAYTIDLVDDSGVSRPVGHYGFGVVDAISPWPLFWAGCTLNSGGPSWQCAFFRPLTRATLYGATADPARNWDESHARALGELLERPTRRVIMGF